MNVISNDSGNATTGISVSVTRPRKRKDHDHDEHESDDESYLHVGDRVDDACRAIVDRRDAIDPGSSALIMRQNLVDRLRHFNGVRAGAAIHRNDHGRRGHLNTAHPEAHVYALVLDRLFDRRHVAQVNRRVVRTADDQVAVLFGGFELALRSQDRGAEECCPTGPRPCSWFRS